MPLWSNGPWRHPTAVFVLAVVSLCGSPAAQAVDLLVGSGSTDKVLRYDGQTGDFIDAFVTAGSGRLNRPLFLIFTPSPPPIRGCILVRGLPLAGATVTFGPESTQSTIDAKGCYTFDTADVSEQGTVTISVPAQP